MTHVKHTMSLEEWKKQREAAREEDLLYEHYTLQASNKQRPLRVDKFLSNLLPFTSRSRIKNASKTGAIMVNDQPVKASFKVKAGDVVKLVLPYPPSPELEPENIPLDIRYEDEYLLVVHKPPGMVCHPSLGHWSGTLVHGLLWHFGQLPQAKGQELPRPGLVHRIDRDTSGILVVAKEEYAMAHLSKQFFDRSTDRLYHALVWGDVQDDTGTIVANVGRSQRNRKLFQAFPADSDKGKHAVTHYQVLERFGVATLLACKLETGRTHQIRVHAKHIGHPLFQDADYGGDKILAGPPTKKYQQFMRNCFALMPRQALHAKSLSFDHPATGQRMHFDSELPADFEAVLQKLRAYAAGMR